MQEVEKQENTEQEVSDFPPVMTVKDVQKLLQIGQTRAYELFQIVEDPPPHIRIGRSIRIPRDAFFEWLAKKAQRGGIR